MIFTRTYIQNLQKTTKQRMNHLITISMHKYVRHFKITACKGEAYFYYIAFVL